MIPFDFPAHATLIATVLPTASLSDSDMGEAWLRATNSSNAFAFLADAAEDIYAVDDGRYFDTS